MNKIELSSAFITPMLSRIVGFSSANAVNMDSTNDKQQASRTQLFPNEFAQGQANDVAYPRVRISIMKGSIPSNFSVDYNIKSLLTDVLVDFNYSDMDPKTIENPYIVQTKHVNAIANGVATWFWFRNYELGYYRDYSTRNLINQIIGDIGLTGSGCCLEIPDVNVVSGNQYRISNLKLEFPTSWEY